MGKISRLRLHVAAVPRDWRTEGVRPEELDLLCRGTGPQQVLAAGMTSRAGEQPVKREEERRDA